MIQRNLLKGKLLLSILCLIIVASFYVEALERKRGREKPIKSQNAKFIKTINKDEAGLFHVLAHAVDKMNANKNVVRAAVPPTSPATPATRPTRPTRPTPPTRPTRPTNCQCNQNCQTCGCPCPAYKKQKQPTILNSTKTFDKKTQNSTKRDFMNEVLDSSVFSKPHTADGWDDFYDNDSPWGSYVAPQMHHNNHFQVSGPRYQAKLSFDDSGHQINEVANEIAHNHVEAYPGEIVSGENYLSKFITPAVYDENRHHTFKSHGYHFARKSDERTDHENTESVVNSLNGFMTPLKVTSHAYNRYNDNPAQYARQQPIRHDSHDHHEGSRRHDLDDNENEDEGENGYRNDQQGGKEGNYDDRQSENRENESSEENHEGEDNRESFNAEQQQSNHGNRDSTDEDREGPYDEQNDQDINQQNQALQEDLNEKERNYHDNKEEYQGNKQEERADTFENEKNNEQYEQEVEQQGVKVEEHSPSEREESKDYVEDKHEHDMSTREQEQRHDSHDITDPHRDSIFFYSQKSRSEENVMPHENVYSKFIGGKESGDKNEEKSRYVENMNGDLKAFIKKLKDKDERTSGEEAAQVDNFTQRTGDDEQGHLERESERNDDAARRSSDVTGKEIKGKTAAMILQGVGTSDERKFVKHLMDLTNGVDKGIEDAFNSQNAMFKFTQQIPIGGESINQLIGIDSSDENSRMIPSDEGTTNVITKSLIKNTKGFDRALLKSQKLKEPRMLKGEHRNKRNNHTMVEDTQNLKNALKKFLSHAQNKIPSKKPDIISKWMHNAFKEMIEEVEHADNRLLHGKSKFKNSAVKPKINAPTSAHESINVNKVILRKRH